MDNFNAKKTDIQLTKSRQNSCMQMVLDYDQKFTKREDFLQALKKALGENVTLVKYQKTKDIYLYKSNGIDHYLICASVTYLGNPHLLFKKRMQLKKWYRRLPSSNGTTWWYMRVCIGN